MAIRMLFPVLLLLVLACAGLRCAGSSSIEGVVFYTGRDGKPVPLGKKKVALYRGTLPDRLRASFPWQDESLARKLSGARVRLYDRGDDLLVVSAYSDISLPESLRLEEWCRLKDESYRKKIAQSLTWQAFFDREKAKIERDSAKLKGD